MSHLNESCYIRMSHLNYDRGGWTLIDCLSIRADSDVSLTFTCAQGLIHVTLMTTQAADPLTAISAQQLINTNCFGALHVTRGTHESRYTYEHATSQIWLRTYSWVLSHMWISHATHMNPNCFGALHVTRGTHVSHHTYEHATSHIWLRTDERDTSHVWTPTVPELYTSHAVHMSHVSHMNAHTYIWITSHIWTRTHTDGSCHTYEQIASKNMNGPRHTREQVTSHMWILNVLELYTSHVKDGVES